MDFLYGMLISVIVVGLISLYVVVVIDRFLRAKEIKNNESKDEYLKEKRF